MNKLKRSKVPTAIAPAKTDATVAWYRIKVESTANPSYGELVSAFDGGVPESIYGGSRPVRLHPSLTDFEPACGEKTMIVKTFDAEVSGEEAIKWGRARGCRPSFPCERHSFHKAHGLAGIADLGSSSDGATPFLGGGNRLLAIHQSGTWPKGTKFLFVIVEEETRRLLNEEATAASHDAAPRLEDGEGIIDAEFEVVGDATASR